MANMQYSVDPQNYNSSMSSMWANGTVGNFGTYTPAVNVIDIGRPRRVSKTTDTTTTRWGFDLGASMSVAAVTIENTNLPDITIKGGTDAAGVTFTNTQDFLSFTTDTDDGRKKNLCVLSGFNSVRYIRVDVKTNPGDGYYQIGSIGIWKTLNTLTKNFSLPYEKTLSDDAEVIEFAQGGIEVGVPQPITIQFALQARMARTDTTAINHYRTLGVYPRNRVFLLYENQSDLSRMYHVRRSGSFRLTRTDNATVTVSGIQLLEVA